MSITRLFIGILLIAAALLSDIDFKSIIDKVKNITNKEKVVSVEPKPDQKDIDDTRGISDLVTDANDKGRLAVFNYEFSNRLPNYKITAQQLVDIYTGAGKIVFGADFKDKYPSFGPALTKLFLDILGEEERTLTSNELLSIQKKFAGLSWNLSQ